MKKIFTLWLLIISIGLLGCGKKTEKIETTPANTAKQTIQSNKSTKTVSDVSLEEVNHIISMTINHKGPGGQSLKEIFPYSGSDWYSDKTFGEPFFINANHYRLITTKEYLNKKYTDDATSDEIKNALKTQSVFMDQMQFYAGQVKEMVNAGRYSVMSPIVMRVSHIMKEQIPQIPWANEQRIKTIMSNLIMLIKEGNRYYSRAYDIYIFIKNNYSVLNEQLNEPGNAGSELSQLKKMLKEYYTHKEIAQYYRYFKTNLRITVLNLSMD